MFIKVDVQMREEGVKELKGIYLAVYLTLALHMNWERIAFPSLDTLVKETGYSRRFIKKALRRLEELGYIECANLSTRSTAYCLNHYVAIGRKEQFKEEGEISDKKDVEKYPLSRYMNDDDNKSTSYKYTSSIYKSSLGEISDTKPDHKNALSEQESKNIINNLRKFGFWDAQEFVWENDPEIIQETIAEVKKVQKAERDPEKLRQRIMKGERYQKIKNPGGYLRGKVRRKMTLRKVQKGLYRHASNN